MNIIPLSFIISSLAGLSTLVGFIFVFFNIKDSSKFIAKCLIFSSSVMFTISLFDLIPSSYAYLIKIYNNILALLIGLIYVLFGAIMAYSINKFIKEDNNLYKIGITSMIAIIIHNIPEGIITFMATTNNTKFGIVLAITIALHNIPEGIAISIPIYYSTGNKKMALLYTFISALSEPIGALIAFLFIDRINNNYFFSIMLLITAGIMIYLSIFELFKEGIKSLCIKDTLLFIFLGLIVILISILL